MYIILFPLFKIFWLSTHLEDLALGGQRCEAWAGQRRDGGLDGQHSVSHPCRVGSLAVGDVGGLLHEGDGLCHRWGRHAVDTEELGCKTKEISMKNIGVKVRNWKIYETKKPKSTLLADNTQGLITTTQTKPRPLASAALHPIGGGGGDENGQYMIQNKEEKNFHWLIFEKQTRVKQKQLMNMVVRYYLKTHNKAKAKKIVYIVWYMIDKCYVVLHDYISIYKNPTKTTDPPPPHINNYKNIVINHNTIC